MNKLIFSLLLGCCVCSASAQSTKTELYDLIKKLVTDSTGYPSVGDWAVGGPKKFPVKWKADRIEMSEDTSINFFRMGTVDMTIRGKSFMQAGQPVKWNIMLKGPRMGYTSFSIISSPSKDLNTTGTIALDSIFWKKPYKAKLIKNCDAKDYAGLTFYELKLPKKDLVYLKLSWVTLNGNRAIRIDGYDPGSSYAAKLDCPK